MVETIFFSWQSDTPPIGNRNLIERALQQAISAITSDAVLHSADRELAIDRDTKGISGTPPIADTIFRKIDSAAVFLADLTFVANRLDGRPTPNPNVLIEYGWALRSLGNPCVIAVMNTVYGKPTRDNMPFNIGHLRNPLLFDCPVEADEAARRAAKESLARQLVMAIKAVLGSPEYERRRTPDLKFEPRVPGDRQSRFRASGEPIGLIEVYRDEEFKELHLVERPSLWLRLMPTRPTNLRFTIPQLRQCVRPYGNVNGLPTISLGLGNPLCVRSVDGYGTWDPAETDEVAGSVAFAFTTGEVWVTDTRVLRLAEQDNYIPLNQRQWATALEKYTAFLGALGVDGPYRWIAGMDGISGRKIFHRGPGRSKQTLAGRCATDVVTAEGFHSPTTSPGSSLDPFFNAIFDACGLSRM